MQTIETTVYNFSALDSSAKEKAREWYRNGAFDYDWWDGVIEDATRIGSILGFNDLKVQFSGFYNQGDGASFSGTWYPPIKPVTTMLEEAPIDTELHSIAREIYAFQRRLKGDDRDCGFRLSKSGRYNHELSMQCDNDELLAIARSFAQWIYRSLESEWEYINSDEQVDESILSNEYTFTAEGKRFG